MSAKISGAELKTGMTIKANGRIYIVSDIEEADWIGARLAELKTSSGKYRRGSSAHLGVLIRS